MFEATLAAMGLVWFCLVFSILAFTVLVAVSTDHYVWAGAALFFAGGLFVVFGGWPDLSWFANNPVHTIGAIVIYLIGGLAWSCVKWYLFLTDMKASEAKRPQARHHKSTIVSWMMYWPFSVIGTCIFDFIRRGWNAVYNYISGLFDKIGDSVYGPPSEDNKSGR